MKAIYSRLDWNEDQRILNFLAIIDDLLENDHVNELKDFNQHFMTNRFQHSLNVAYYTYLWCEKLHLDSSHAARAALLHDLFFYDYFKHEHESWHPALHPRVAAKNAKMITDLTPMMEDSILKHMWPLTWHKPLYPEGWVVTMADKYCAACEVIDSCYLAFKLSRICFVLVIMASIF